MKFSVTLMSRIGDAQLAVDAENLGYDAVWFSDNQMLWSDCFATMALAAQATNTIRLGTGVSVPGTRVAPVNAHSIATINQIAPGRTFIGIGTGGSGVRLLGQNPLRLGEFEEYLVVLRALLQGEEVDYTVDGVTHNIRFLNEGLGFRNVEDRIPIYIAANGPKALRLAGRCGDGLISAGGDDAETIAERLKNVREGAQAAGRPLPPDFQTAVVSNAIVLHPGEKLTDDRVIDAAGAFVCSILHWAYALYLDSGNEDNIPSFLHDTWEEYRDFVENLDTPPEKLFRELHEGHTTHLPPEERRFITPALIEASSLVGSADEIAEKLRESEAAGLNDLILLWPLDHLAELMRDFTEVMKRM